MRVDNPVTSPIRATRQQWQDLVESIVWQDLKELIRDSVELNRDIMEGVMSQEAASRESMEALRGRCRALRELVARVEGFADGTLPLDDTIGLYND